jgi:hypothetical protein
MSLLEERNIGYKQDIYILLKRGDAVFMGRAGTLKGRVSERKATVNGGASHRKGKQMAPSSLPRCPRTKTNTRRKQYET